MRLWLRVGIAILSSLFTNNAWAQPNDLLVKFCMEYVQAEQSVLEPARWSQLVERLKTSSDSSPEALPSGLKLADCESRFSTDFEVGQFILRGREIIENTRTALIHRGTSQLDPQAPIEVTLTSIGEIRLGAAADTQPSSEIADDLTRRERDYDRMWNEFLSALRQKIDTAPIVTQLTVIAK